MAQHVYSSRYFENGNFLASGSVYKNTQVVNLDTLGQKLSDNLKIFYLQEYAQLDIDVKIITND